jgi:DNA-binding response OmpR family regulator
MVDDDPRLCGFVTKFLAREGYAAEFVYDGNAMQQALANDPFDLIILDLTFPNGEDGITLARTIRTRYDTPLVMLSGRHDTLDKVVCLEIGADDYLTKPFEPRELLARIRTVLRRTRSALDKAPAAPSNSDVILFAGWRLDLSRRELSSPDSNNVPLTSHEFHLLSALVQRAGRVLTRDQILDLIANRQWTPFDRSIDVLIAKLRRKLNDSSRGRQMIKTVRGAGYVFTLSPESSH